MSDLSEIERLLAETACIRLAKDFALSSDLLEFEKYGSLYTQDGSFERPGLSVSGRAAIVEALRSRPPERKMRHLLTNATVDVSDPDAATGRGNYIVYLQAGGDEPVSSGTVDYRDTYRRENGRWCIQSRVVTMSFQ